MSKVVVAALQNKGGKYELLLRYLANHQMGCGLRELEGLGMDIFCFNRG